MTDRDRILGYGERALDDTAATIDSAILGYGQTVAAQPGGSPTPRPALSRLAIVDRSDALLVRFAKVVAMITYGIEPDDVLEVRSWSDLGKKLSLFESIDVAYLLLHGYPGSVLVGGVSTRLGEENSLKPFGERPPKIRELHFPSCRLTRDPRNLLQFGSHLGAQRLIGPTLAHHYGIKTFKGPASAEKIKELEYEYGEYLLTNHPPVAELAKQRGEQEIVYEWYSAIRLPLDAVMPPRLERAASPGKYQSRSSAEAKEISTEEQADKYYKEWQKPHKDDPLHMVTIKPGNA